MQAVLTHLKGCQVRDSFLSQNFQDCSKTVDPASNKNHVNKDQKASWFFFFNGFNVHALKFCIRKKSTLVTTKQDLLERRTTAIVNRANIFP